MLFCIWSTVFLTQCSIGVLDMFSFASARTTSVGNKLHALDSQRNVVEKLEFWDGEDFKTCKKHAACRKNRKHIHTNKRLKNKNRKHRRHLIGYASLSVEEHKRSTRFALEDLEHTSPIPDVSSLEKTIRNTKINGYTLLEDMTSLMKTLTDQNTSVSVIGKTIERHDIVVCHISEHRRHNLLHLRRYGKKYVSDEEEQDKKIIFIVHGLSSMGFREVPCLYKKESFMKLLNLYMKHLHQFDILLVPMGNPDGISDETLQMWNKNKRPQAACSGVAVDRNFDVKWNRTHKLHSCSQQYSGPAPFSEPESRAIADLIHVYSQKIIAYIHVHAGTYDPRTFKGDAVLFPKGYNNENPDEKYSDLATTIAEDIRNAGFRKYDVHLTSLHKWYGQVSGTSVDYTTTVYGIPYGLEFVMQSYRDVRSLTTTSEETQDNVLSEVWSRIIHAVFDGIYKSTQSDTD